MNNLKSTIKKIQSLLKEGAYEREEHVRFSLISRILLDLGWDIWNPKEVHTEFPMRKPVSGKGFVDLVIVNTKTKIPWVFVEIKRDGRSLDNHEPQLSEYLSQNMAPYSILTNGDEWRFYLSREIGEMSDRLFNRFFIRDGNSLKIATFFSHYFSKKSVHLKNRETDAKRLHIAYKKRVRISAFLPKAKEIISILKSINLSDAIVMAAKEKGVKISEDEAVTFLEKHVTRIPIGPRPRTPNPPKKGRPNGFPPNGTLCRMMYKGNQFTAKIFEDSISVVEYGKHTSFSAASRAITNTPRNGWTDWEIQLPRTSEWILADKWRSQIKS